MNRRNFLTASVAAATSAALPRVASAAPAPNSRIAWTADGNYWDKDDWGASTMALLLLADANQRHRLVHFDFNNYVPNSVRSWEQQMQISVFDSRPRYGYNAPVFFNDKPKNDAAVRNLKAEILASTPNDRLTICLAGIAEVLWQALQGVPNHVRSCVDVISHSTSYNDVKGPHPLRMCTGVRVQHIPNQNDRLNTQQNWGPWAWMNNSRRPELQWAYNRMRAIGRADVSDSGMMYYCIYGKSTPTIADFKAKLL